MVCSCKDLCKCEEHCTCCGRRCTCLVCHRIKVCNCDIFPICKATAPNPKSDMKFCQCFQSAIEEETLTHSATNFTEDVGIITSTEKPKEYKLSKNDITIPKTLYESTFNDSKMPISDNGQLSKISNQKKSNASPFGSLKLTFQRIKSRFKNFKNRKSDHSALLTVEQEREDSDEQTVETSTNERNNFSCKRTTESDNNKINSYSTENFLPLSKVDKVSFASIDHNILASDHAKSPQFTSNAETHPGIDIHHEESTGTFDDNWISTNNSFQSRQTSFTSFSNLHWSDVDYNLYETLYTCSSGKQARKSPEEAEFTNNKINSCSTENFLPSSKVDKVSFASIDQNVLASDHAKSPQITSNPETHPGMDIHHEESTGTFNDNFISMNNSFQSRQTSFTSFSNLHWSDVDVNLYETLYTCSSGKPERKSPEDVEYVNMDFKTSDNSARTQFDATSEPLHLLGNIPQSRSTSANDKNMASLFYNFQDESPSTSTELHSSHSSKLSFRSSSEKDTDSQLSDYNIHSRVSNSEVESYSLNESSKALISSSAASSESSTLPEDNETHSSSRRPLFCLSSNSSLDSVCILELSLDESLDLNNSDPQDRNIMDVPNSRLVSSDLSDSLETLDTGTSSDSTDSESVSSTEFLPCSYCRSITSLNSDSIIPYEILE